MQLFDALASAFFKTFGITQPSEDHLRRATWFIFTLLVLSLVLVTTAGIVFYRLMHH